MNILVTGGCGFIGSHVVDYLYEQPGVDKIVVLDLLTYAGTTKYLPKDEKRVIFLNGDVASHAAVAHAAEEYNISHVIHLAAETHVDNSIKNSDAFVHSNVSGTHNLLRFFNEFWGNNKDHLMVHVSTDEVFGSLGPEDPKFNPESPYKPSSPYSATKAASDHLCRAWNRTYGFPVVVTNCSNNFGPRQNKEKLIPTVIHKIKKNDWVPVYSSGKNVRDWLYVRDHAECLYKILTGTVGGQYLIGGDNEWSNIDLVKKIYDLFEEIARIRVERKILHVTDRPGHDFRYAIDSTYTQYVFGWRPSKDFEYNLGTTIEWYLENE